MATTHWCTALVCLMLTGCQTLPRDPEGTEKRVRAERQVTVGFIGRSEQDPVAARFTSELGRRTGAVMSARHGDGETMLQALATGKVDLVLGSFVAASPWQTDVAFAPALSRSGPKGHEIEFKAAVRNGENRWLMLVESVSRAVSAKARP